MELVYQLRLIADACRHAHLLATSPESADPRAPALVKEGGELRARMLGSAELLALYGHVPAEVVASIRAGSGNIDLTNDLEQLEVLFRQLPDELKKTVFVTEDMVHRAGTLARELAHLFGIKEFGGATDTNHPQRMRQKAYALLIRAYDEARRGIGFLRARHGDADQIAPSLYLKQRKRAQSADVQEEEAEVVEPTEVAPTPPAPAPAPSTDTVSTV